MFGYWSNVQYVGLEGETPQWQNPGKMDGATLNLAAQITPLYEWLTNRLG